MKPLLLTLTLLLTALPIRADVHLLGSPQIRRELGIPHDLSLRILHNLNEANRLNRGGIMTAEEAKALKKERSHTSPRTLERQIRQWLSPAQKLRLEQIELQLAGPLLLENWNFAQRIGMTPQQHKKLLPVFKGAFQKYVKEAQALSRANASWFGTLDHKRYASKYADYYSKATRLGEQMKTTVDTALNKSLTQTQKAKWQTLRGKPFRARLSYDTKSYPMD